MYIQRQFEETRVDVLHELIRQHPLGMIVTLQEQGLNANHLPFELDPDPAPYGTLRTHVARGNPIWRDFSTEVAPLIVFQGAQSYITPSWYATKQETGKVVPTYNYMVVHGYGSLRIVDDPVWLRGLVERLTERFEAAQPLPWKPADAPADYLEKQLQAIVGIEIPLAKLVGKWKLNQNRSEADRAGVACGLHETGNADAMAMADAIRQSLRAD